MVRMNKATSNVGRQRALADAIAGVAGSVLALWAFYPIEVLKTNAQAGGLKRMMSSDGSMNADSTNANETDANQNTTDDESTQLNLFSGIGFKTMHTTTSSFAYFYIYSLIVHLWKARRATADTTISSSTRLLLSALAAMANTIFTLPLDVMAANRITQPKAGRPNNINASTKNDVMAAVWESLEQDVESAAVAKNATARIQHGVIDRNQSSCEGEKKEEHSAPPTTSATNATSIDEDKPAQEEFQISELWNGLTPSLLLCSNPAINYTIYDALKVNAIQRLQTGSNSSTNQHLSMKQAFLLGLFAKFVATIATYPLIRAKVMLMVTSSSSKTSSQHPKLTLWKCLQECFQKHGVRGLYEGSKWQLLHTALKSALMMMIKERIATVSHRLLVTPSDS